MSVVKDVLASRELFLSLAKREISGKYKRTVLGQLWSLINPIAAMIIYSLVFSFLLRISPRPGDPSGLDVYALWLLCGLLPWGFFVATVNGGMGVILSNAGLIKKVAFPRITLPLASAAAAAYNWSFEMTILVVVISITGAFVLPYLPLVIVFMVLLAAFAVGFALLMSIVNVHFRDTQYLMSIIFQMWMYLTPIIYPISLVAQQSEAAGSLGGITILDIYRLNPMERFVEVFRNLIYDNRLPGWGDSLYCLVFAALSLTVGLWVFQRSSKRLAEIL